MACNILNERDGMFEPMYFFGERALCSDGGTGEGTRSEGGVGEVEDI